MVKGIEVKLNTDYFDARERWSETKEVTYDKVLFTGMIDEFYQYELGTLEYRRVCFEEELIENCENYQGNAVINYTEREIPYTRIIEHKHFEFGQQKDTIISREYPSEWHQGEQPYYPVNNEKNDALFREYQKLAEEKDSGKILFGGRLGQYKYYDMDKVIRAALEMVEMQQVLIIITPCLKN